MVVGTLSNASIGLSTVQKGTAVTVIATGELDLVNVAMLEREVRRLSDTLATRIVLDLSRLEFIASAGISLLVRLAAESRRDGDRLRIVRGSAAVQRLLELTGAARQLHFVVTPA